MDSYDARILLLRAALEDAAEAIINLLDIMEMDPELEESDPAEEGG